MSRKVLLLIGILISALAGLLLTFYFWPYFIDHKDFVIGFTTCLSAISLGLITFFLLKKRRLKIHKDSDDFKEQFGNTSDLDLSKIFFYILILGFVTSMLGLVFWNYNEELKSSQVDFQKQQLEKQEELIESVRHEGLMHLMSSLIESIEVNLDKSQDRSLSNEIIERIAWLSQSFKPYKVNTADSLGARKFSPERGRLLVYLCNLDLDTIILSKIFSQSSFLGADLRGENLEGLYLNGIQLNGSDLSNSKLNGSSIKGGNLENAILWGADLSNANLNNAKMKRANLAWSNLDGASFVKADLDGASLRQAKMRHANMGYAQINWSNLDGAILNHADFSNAEVFGTSFVRVIAEGIILENANMRTTNWHEASMKNARLKNAILRGATFNKTEMGTVDLTNASVLQEEWFELLDEWAVVGRDSLKKKYFIKKDDSPVENYLLLETTDDPD